MQLIPKTAKHKAHRGEVAVPARLPVKKVAEWLGCSEANVKDIESRKVGRKLQDGARVIRLLTPEQAEIVAYQTGVNRRWLLDNDVSKPITNSLGKPYTQKDFEQRQAEIKSGKGSFANPRQVGEMVEQVNRLAEGFGMVAAIVLQGLERGQADIYAYKLRRALQKVYDFKGEQGAREWQALGVKAIYGGQITATRPDLGPLLDEWEARFKEIAKRKSGGKAPLKFLRRARSVPFGRRVARRPKSKRKPARR